MVFKKTLFFFFILLTLSVGKILGQKNCSFKVDTTKVLSNKNLDKFLSRLQSDSFTVNNTKAAIPKSIKKQLNCLTEGFSIANPNELYRCCCTSPRSLPRRKLLFLAKSNDVLIMTYLTGGVGVSTHIVLIEFRNNKIVDLWAGVGFGNLTSKESIIAYIKSNRYKEWGLNTNIISI